VKEKRSTPRISPYLASCVVMDGSRALAGFLTEVSLRGGRVTTQDEPPGVGAGVVLELKIGRRVASCRLLAAVKWVRPGPRGAQLFGLSFEGMGTEERSALAAVIEEFRVRAATINSGRTTKERS
jgi:hypothetical protein